MLRIRTLGGLIRRYSTKGTPFQESHLKGDDKYQDLNSYYSDLFTGAEPSNTIQSKPETLQDDIEEINSELNELYGVDTPTEIQEIPKVVEKQSLLDKIKSNVPKIFVSNSTNPFLNLALEDYIFQHTPVSKPFAAQRLIFYTNSPCVVVGKNQNPWRETNLPIINNLQIPLLRRRSGGGTVVHDLGNVNYSYITSREAFSRDYFGSVIVKSLNQVLDSENKIEQNERGDIVTNGKKLSGSAFKISKGKSYHHGTMLLNSKLDVLRQLLDRKGREGIMEFECNAVDSVPSPVTNLGIENSEFVDLVQAGFRETFGQVEVVEVDEFDQEIQQIAEELQEWKWRFGATPKFTLKLSNKEYDLQMTFKVEKGILKEFSVDCPDLQIEQSFGYLSQVIDSGEDIKFIGSEIAGFVLHDVISEWLGNQIDGTN